MADNIRKNELQALSIFKQLQATPDGLWTIAQLQEAWDAAGFGPDFDEGLDGLVTKGLVSMDAAQISAMLTQKGFDRL